MSKREETRKLQLTGGASYIISLPKKWVNEMHLKKGDVISITVNDDGTILLSPANTRIEKPNLGVIRVSADSNVNTIIRKIVSAYLVGYDNIEVRSEEEQITSKLRNMIQDFTRRMLVGTEIVYDSPSVLRLQVLIRSPELSVKNAVRRMSFLSMSMLEDAISAVRKHDRKLAREVITMDDEVDRFNHYVVRQLKSAIQNKSLLKDIELNSPREILGYRLITKAIERIADHAVSIAKEVLKLESEISVETLEKISIMGSLASKVFKEAINSLYRQDFNLADKIIEESRRVTLMEGEIIKIISDKAEPEAPSLRLITESIKRAAEYASDIAEIVLNLTIEKIISHDKGLSRTPNSM